MKIPLKLTVVSVADPGFGRGGPTLKREGCTPSERSDGERVQ